MKRHLLAKQAGWALALGFLGLFPRLAHTAEPSPTTLSADDLHAEIARLEKETTQLRSSADAPVEWKESLRVDAQIRQVENTQRATVESLQRWLQELYSVPACQTWAQHIFGLERRLADLQMEDYRRIHDTGREVYTARYKALERWAVAAPPRARQLGFDVLSYPRMDGSTSTQPLAVLIACHCLGAAHEWVAQEQFRARMWGGGMPYQFSPRRSEPELELLQFTLQAAAPTPADGRLATIINGLLAPNRDTHQAYVNLIEGASDIGLIARPPSAGERELARQKNVELDIAPCALDALVFLVNRDNSLQGLTTAQIRDIYSGKVKNWLDVGGAAGAITPYQREEDSGSQELMRQMVMQDLPFVKDRLGNPDRLIVYGMGGPYVRLTTDKLGLAYSVYYYERYMAGSPNTRTIAVDGIEPSYETIRDRKYPFTAEVLVVTRKGLAPNSPAARLRQWLLSPEGQSVVRESGYVPIAEQ
jgi:phosphate transport system substrate-binding protein